MATFTVRIDCDNAAFGEDDWNCTQEIARILHEIAERIKRDGDGMQCWETIHDANGNDVGRFALKDYPSQSIRKWRNASGKDND